MKFYFFAQPFKVRLVIILSSFIFVSCEESTELGNNGEIERLDSLQKKTAEEISKRSNNIVNPNRQNANSVLIKFDTIPQSTIDSMAKKSFDNFVATSSFVKVIINTYIPTLEKYAKEFISQNRVSSEVLQSSINSGNTFREIFIAELKKQGVDNELLEFLLKKFDENDTFKVADEMLVNLKI